VKIYLKQELNLPAMGWFAEMQYQSWSSDLSLFFSVKMKTDLKQDTPALVPQSQCLLGENSPIF
jgi:hypothetical protein